MATRQEIAVLGGLASVTLLILLIAANFGAAPKPSPAGNGTQPASGQIARTGGAASTYHRKEDVTDRRQPAKFSSIQSDRLGGHSEKLFPSPQTPASSPPGSAKPSRYYDFDYRPAVGEQYVPGYFRRDGTYVSGHFRTNSDDSFWNNWSSQGNMNPHTDKVGTRRPPRFSDGSLTTRKNLPAPKQPAAPRTQKSLGRK